MLVEVLFKSISFSNKEDIINIICGNFKDLGDARDPIRPHPSIRLGLCEKCSNSYEFYPNSAGTHLPNRLLLIDDHFKDPGVVPFPEYTHKLIWFLNYKPCHKIIDKK